MRTLLTFVLLWVPLCTFAQKAEPVPQPKFGKINAAKLLKNDYSGVDSSASAIVLADYGRSYFSYNQGAGAFMFYFERYKQVKILDKDGYDAADVSIGLYGANGDEETANTIKGYTYNMVNGKVEKSKLEKTAIFTEEQSENWTARKFTMPDVSEGSIIEYQYTIISPYTYNLREWEFQSDIPVLYSQYEVTIPEYFDYQQIASGYHPYAIYDQSQVAGSLSVASANRRETSSSFSQNTLQYRQNKYLWVAMDVPAFKNESYINNPYDYVTKVEFELRGVQYPNSAYEAVMGDWNELNDTFLKSSQFGNAIRTNGFLKQPLAPFETMEPEQKMSKAVQLIRNQIEWNGQNRRLASSTLKKSWDDKSGSSADINLTVVAAIRRLGLDADPVLISTRSHGIVREFIPVSKQFNYVICVVRVGDMRYLLDATDRYLPVGVLPERCLNGNGRIISETQPGWINLESSEFSETSIVGQLELKESGELVGKLKIVSKGYDAYNLREKFLQKGQEKYVQELNENNKVWNLSSPTFKDEKALNQPFTQSFDVNVDEVIESAGNLLFIKPLMTEGIESNPFKLEERKYPVDFGHPIKKQYTMMIKIPEGYVVDDVPKPANVALPDNAGKFQYVVSQMGNTINITNIYLVNKSMFLPDEYPYLKEFYNIMVAKHAEQIVLKKL